MARADDHLSSKTPKLKSAVHREVGAVTDKAARVSNDDGSVFSHRSVLYQTP